MKAIILAAGKGTRLDGAAVKPKCLVEIGGQTLLRRQIESLRDVRELTQLLAAPHAHRKG